MPRLMTVSGNHLDLLPAKSYVLGRDKICDIVVEDCSCSRQHAKITVNASGDGLYLEDLNSRNGTFLDGDKVESIIIAPEGSKVRIGSTIFAVCLEDADDSLAETCVMYSETVALSSVPKNPLSQEASASSIEGDLASMNILEVIQVLHQMGRSGQLRLSIGSTVGSVDLTGGEVFDAEFSGAVGTDALAKLMGESEGRFEFAEFDSPAKREIEASTQELLLELCRVQDESTHVETEQA